MKYIRNIGIPVFFSFFNVLAAVFCIAVLHDRNAVVVTIIADLALCVVGSIYYLKCLRKDNAPNKVNNIHFCIVIAMSVVIWLVTQIMATWIINTWPDSAVMLEEAVEMSPSAYLLLTLFVAPFSEEILFRGIWFTHLKRLWGRLPAYVLSIAFFSWMHQNAPQGYVAVFGGIMYLLVYEFTGKLRWAIFVHSFHNLLAVCSNVIPIPDWMFIPAITMVCNAIAAALLIYGYVMVGKIVAAKAMTNVSVSDDIVVRDAVVVDDGHTDYAGYESGDVIESVEAVDSIDFKDESSDEND